MKHMQEALIEAKKAFEAGEVPVGCVIVKNGKTISSTHNTTEALKDPTCHAEINAIKKALAAVGEKSLADCELYVTLEPCAMCAGAVINSKIKRVYIGAQEPKSGCFGSVVDLSKAGLNHKPEIYIGICEDECKDILKKFFKDKR